MRTWVRSSAIGRFAGMVATVWLCVMSPAWAGDGGDDAGAFQQALNTVCGLIGMTPCLQMPTLTQVVLEISGLQNTSPDFVRGPQGSFNTAEFAFGGLCAVSSGSNLPVCSENDAINSINPPKSSPVGVSDLTSLTPLAFATGKGQAVPVPLGTSGANSYFSAVVTAEQSINLNTLTMFFDYPLQTNLSFQKGKVFANISMPLQVLANGKERLICGATGCPASVATLQISATCSNGQGCLTGNVIGDVSTAGVISTTPATALGIQTTASFAPSQASAVSHLILEVKVPLLLTAATDPAYFGVPPFTTGSPTFVNQLSGLPTGFTKEVVPSSNVGLSPQAAPACSGGACPTPPSPLPTTTLPFCASFSGGGSGPLGSGSFHSAVATFLAIGTDGTTYVSSPVPPLPPWLQCPF